MIEGAIREDHVHLYLSVPPKHSPAYVMKILKGKGAEYLRRDFPELSKKYWGVHRRNDQTIYQETSRRRITRGAKEIMERQQRMTLSGVFVF